MLSRTAQFQSQSEYQFNAKNDQIHKISEILGLDETKLRKLINAGITKSNINEYGRFDDLIASIDKEKAKAYFEKLENKKIPQFRVNIKAHNLIQDFIISGEFDI